MNTIHLSDAPRDTFAASGIIVIDGERCHYCDGQGWLVFETGKGDGMQCHPCGGTGWLAPEGWRILTEPCPCGDSEFDLAVTHESRWDDTLHRAVWFDPDHPDCVGGRRVVTLTATCPPSEHLVTIDRGVCERCRGMIAPGKVALGEHTIPALLPVTVPITPGGIDEPCPKYPHAFGSFKRIGGVESYDLWICDGHESEVVEDFPLPPPGAFVAIPEAVA